MCKTPFQGKVVGIAEIEKNSLDLGELTLKPCKCNENSRILSLPSFCNILIQIILMN